MEGYLSTQQDDGSKQPPPYVSSVEGYLNTQQDDGSKQPPPYVNSVTHQEVTFTDTKPYPIQPGVQPPSYSYPATVSTQQASVAVVTSQPVSYSLQQTRSTVIASQPADYLFGLSICWCVICLLCGSPLTLFCFVPAIVLALKVNLSKYVSINFLYRIIKNIISLFRQNITWQMEILMEPKKQYVLHVF